MRVTMMLAVLATALALGGPALAQAAVPSGQAATPSLSPPVPIEEWSPDKVNTMGRAIYRQDTAAWQATDALLAAFDRDRLTDLRGWIVVPEGDDLKVRFLRQTPSGFRPGWDVVVTADGAGPVTIPADDPLTARETAQWQARQTALANVGTLRCSANLNTVVVADPDSDDWLVWLLTTTTDANIVPMGGHYRFRISADGLTMVRRDQLSNGCLNMALTSPDRPQRPEALVVTQIVSSGPVETHVFLSLQNRIPIYVIHGDTTFVVEGDCIRDVSCDFH
jgi:hypothetical protein